MKVFITGTGTGVGKTWVSAVLAGEAILRGDTVAYYKPIQTGCPVDAPEDPDFVRAQCGEGVSIHHRYVFEPPVTPSIADPDGTIDLALIQADVAQFDARYDLLIIEGAGGLMVPVSHEVLMVDLIKQLGYPVLLVADSGLGTINHTLLSLMLLANAEIPLSGIVFNRYPKDLSQATIAEQTLLQAIRPYLPASLPLWTLCEGERTLQAISV